MEKAWAGVGRARCEACGPEPSGDLKDSSEGTGKQHWNVKMSGSNTDCAYLQQQLPAQGQIPASPREHPRTGGLALAWGVASSHLTASP